MTGGDQFQDLDFPQAEHLAGRVACQLYGNIRLHVRATLVNRPHDVQQFGTDQSFQHIGLGAGFQGAMYAHVAIVSREHDQFRVGKFAPNRNGRIDSVHQRHLQIHQGDIWAKFSIFVDAFSRACRLANQAQIRMIGDQIANAAQDQGVVVDSKNIDRRNGCLHVTTPRGPKTAPIMSRTREK